MGERKRASEGRALRCFAAIGGDAKASCFRALAFFTAAFCVADLIFVTLFCVGSSSLYDLTSANITIRFEIKVQCSINVSSTGRSGRGSTIFSVQVRNCLRNCLCKCLRA